ncbi:MAG: NYN domain-containing protein [Verrucomicrobiota bacterium]|nr:NYN domain-containing protein [Verrucomicrobiota bacterium]
MMYFLIDGYNLLFSWAEEGHSLQVQRNRMIQWLRSIFNKKNLRGLVIFDGAHRRGEESGLSYASPLEIAYTPKGQSADEYILEYLEGQKKLSTTVIVTNDQGLRRRAASLNVKVQSNHVFLRSLAKQSKRVDEKNPTIGETSQQIERLLKIFEKKFREENE